MDVDTIINDWKQADLDKEARKLKARLKAIERRRAELTKGLDG